MAEEARVGVVSSPRHEVWIEKALEDKLVTMLAIDNPDITGILDNYQATGIRTVVVDDDVIGESDELQDELCKWLKSHSGPYVRIVLLSDNVREAESPFFYRLVSDCGLTDILVCSECGDPIGRLCKLCEEPMSMMEYSRWKTNDVRMWQKKEPGLLGKLFGSGKKAKKEEPADDPEQKKGKSKKEKKKEKKAKKAKKGKSAEHEDVEAPEDEPETSLEFPAVGEMPNDAVKAPSEEVAEDDDSGDAAADPVPAARETEGPAEAGSLYGDFGDEEDELDAEADEQEELAQPEGKPKKKIVLDLDDLDVPQAREETATAGLASEQTQVMRAVEAGPTAAEPASRATSSEGGPMAAGPDPDLIRRLVEEQMAEKLAALKAEADANAAAELENLQKALDEKESELKRKEQEIEDSRAKAEADAAESARRIEEREAELSARNRKLDERNAEMEAMAKEAEKQKADLEEEKASLAAEREAIDAERAAAPAGPAEGPTAFEPMAKPESKADDVLRTTVHGTGDRSPEAPESGGESSEEPDPATDAEPHAESTQSEEGKEKEPGSDGLPGAADDDGAGQVPSGDEGNGQDKQTGDDMELVVLDPQGEFEELASAFSVNRAEDGGEPPLDGNPDSDREEDEATVESEGTDKGGAAKSSKKNRGRNHKNKSKEKSMKPDKAQVPEHGESDAEAMQEGEVGMGQVKEQDEPGTKAPSGTFELTYDGTPLPVVMLDPRMIDYSDFMPKRKVELTLPSAESVVSIASVRGGIGSTHTAVCCGIAAAKVGASVAVAMRTAKSIRCMHRTLEDTAPIPNSHGIRWRGCDFFPWEEQRAHSHDYELVIADCGCIDLNVVDRNSATNLFLNHSKVACMLTSNSPYDFYLLSEKLKSVNRRQASSWTIGLHSCDTETELSLSDMYAAIAGLQAEEARSHMWRQPFQPSLYSSNKLKQAGAYEMLIRPALPGTFRKHLDEKAGKAATQNAKPNDAKQAAVADDEPVKEVAGNAASPDGGKQQDPTA